MKRSPPYTSLWIPTFVGMGPILYKAKSKRLRWGENTRGKASGVKMMDARLGVITCDKCGEPMEKGQNVIIITEGKIANSNDEPDFQGSGVRYACHINCWDNVEDDPWDKGIVRY
ncbi:MAG: hypothetical protein HYX80_08920 [Chloroflexi bacterium]|nr:hypothetical protein [Chloroflexota bacterium]